jgi:hypothetical protein
MTWRPVCKGDLKPNFLGPRHAVLPGIHSCILILFWSFAVIACKSMRVYEDLNISASFISNAGFDTKCNFPLRTAHLTFLEAIDAPPL